MLNSILHYNRSLGGAVGWGTAVQALRPGSIPDVVIALIFRVALWPNISSRNIFRE